MLKHLLQLQFDSRAARKADTESAKTDPVSCPDIIRSPFFGLVYSDRYASFSSGASSGSVVGSGNCKSFSFARLAIS